jgi:hypothetical protein
MIHPSLAFNVDDLVKYSAECNCKYAMSGAKYKKSIWNYQLEKLYSSWKLLFFLLIEYFKANNKLVPQRKKINTSVFWQCKDYACAKIWTQIAHMDSLKLVH